MKNTFAILGLLLWSNLIFTQTKPTQINICDELQLIKISENAYVHVSYIHQPNGTKTPCNGMILVDNNKAFLFDTPNIDSTTQILLSFISDSLKLQVTGFVTNDWHWDSMGGLAVLNSMGIVSYANEMTRQIAKSKGLPAPTIGFTDSLAIKFGDKDIFCYYLGAAHTIDNIVVWIPSEQILFADCMIKELAATNLGFTGDGDLKEYPVTLKKVSEKFPNAKTVIPGHGLYGGFELIDHTIKMAKSK
jgi:metallo-beta-lactamase class B